MRDRKNILVLVLAALLMALPFVGQLPLTSTSAPLPAAKSSTASLVGDSADTNTACGVTVETAGLDAWQAGRDRHRTVADPDRKTSARDVRSSRYTALPPGGLLTPCHASEAASAAQSPRALQVFRC